MTVPADLKGRLLFAMRRGSVIATIAPSPIACAHADDPQTAPANSAAFVVSAGDPRATAEMLSDALAAGDTDTVRALLQKDVLIYESGGVETSAAEYFEHHLAADVAFLAKLQREQLSQNVGGDGLNAWVATRSRLTGQFDGKDVDLDSTETLVLTKTERGWRIAHIHWSSAPH